jgi:hypothetical protein
LFFQVYFAHFLNSIYYFCLNNQVFKINSITNIFESNSVYWQEWLAGWEDAHTKIINEARASSGCSKPKCCKNFIQD